MKMCNLFWGYNIIFICYFASIGNNNNINHLHKTFQNKMFIFRIQLTQIFRMIIIDHHHQLVVGDTLRDGSNFIL